MGLPYEYRAERGTIQALCLNIPSGSSPTNEPPVCVDMANEWEPEYPCSKQLPQFALTQNGNPS